MNRDKWPLRLTRINYVSTGNAHRVFRDPISVRRIFQPVMSRDVSTICHRVPVVLWHLRRLAPKNQVNIIANDRGDMPAMLLPVRARIVVKERASSCNRGALDRAGIHAIRILAQYRTIIDDTLICGALSRLDANLGFNLTPVSGSRATSAAALGCCGREGVTDAWTDLRLRHTYTGNHTPHLSRRTRLLLHLRFSKCTTLSNIETTRGKLVPL